MMKAKANTISRPTTLGEIAKAAPRLHPDIVLQLLNSLDNTDMVLERNGESLRIDRFSRMYALTRGQVTYCEDGLATVIDCDFMKDPHFLDSYNDGREPESYFRWRLYNSCWAADKVKSLEGDFVECGVNKGDGVMTVMKYIDFSSTGKLFWMLDTYEGLAMELLTDEERQMGIGTAYNSHYEDTYEQVSERFRDYDCVRIIKGRVPDTLQQVTAEKVCFLSIDMNNAVPEIAAAEYFWDRLVSGAIAILDDYAWKTHPVQKREFDKFAKQRNVNILTMPTGQGLIFKP